MHMTDRHTTFRNERHMTKQRVMDRAALEGNMAERRHSVRQGSYKAQELKKELALIPCQARGNSSLVENSEKLTYFITLGSYCYIQECDCLVHLLMTVHIPGSPNCRGLGVNIDECTGNNIFSFMDGFSGYNQNTIHPEDHHNTTFIFPWGTFAYKKMPFGLKNVAMAFQRAISYAFLNIKHIIEAYLDDLDACSQKRIDHPHHIRLIF